MATIRNVQKQGTFEQLKVERKYGEISTGARIKDILSGLTPNEKIDSQLQNRHIDIKLLRDNMIKVLREETGKRKVAARKQFGPSDQVQKADAAYAYASDPLFVGAAVRSGVTKETVAIALERQSREFSRSLPK